MTNPERAALAAVQQYGSIRKAAAALDVPYTSFWNTVARAREQQDEPADFERPALPSATLPVDRLLARRREEWAAKEAAAAARRLIPVAIKLDGPVGIAHMGDPHVDDNGTNLPLLERHLAVINSTRGLFAANVGDARNNWVGRLGRLYGEQSSSADEALALTEWLIRGAQWLYLIGGNHDAWSGTDDPIKWIMRQQPGVYETNGARLELRFRNGRTIRVNARHDFRGHSMWNTAHGPAKAVQMGWRDHILTCGHLHTTGYQALKCPATGLVSHAMRVASYKHLDRYADTLGLPDQNISECMVTIIDPDAPDERRLITVFLDVEEAAEYLTWRRAKHAGGKHVSGV